MSKLIVLSGGGTLGPVTPLLAFVELAKREGKDWDFVWVGTHGGPERTLVIDLGIPFQSIYSGKWDRFFSVQNILAPGKTVVGFLQSFTLLWRLRPAIVLTAGGFVCVPLAWAAWCLRIPVAVHQQDVAWGLANRLMRPLAKLITTVFSYNNDDNNPRVAVIGNCVRPMVHEGSKERALSRLGFSGTRPIVLVTGGGTGALFINQLVEQTLPLLSEKVDVIHLSGLGKKVDLPNSAWYFQADFAREEMSDYLVAADVVISRASMSTLSELAVLQKAVIVIPMPNTHQEQNARKVREADAGLFLSQEVLTSERFLTELLTLIDDRGRRQRYGLALHELIADGTATYLALVSKIIGVGPAAPSPHQLPSSGAANVAGSPGGITHLSKI